MWHNLHKFLYLKYFQFKIRFQTQKKFNNRPKIFRGQTASLLCCFLVKLKQKVDVIRNLVWVEIYNFTICIQFLIRMFVNLREHKKIYQGTRAYMDDRTSEYKSKIFENAKSEHLFGWSFLNLTDEIGLLRNQGFWLGADILRCLYHSNI